MKKISILGIISLLFISCAEKETIDTLSVVTTTSFVSHTITRIGGEKIEINPLIKYGQDPHSYTPTPRHMAKVEKADLIFVNGFVLEEGLIHILEANNKGKIIALSSTIDPINHDQDDHDQDDHDQDDHDQDEHHHVIDPHSWMSPINMIKWAEIACITLKDADPINAQFYQNNCDSFISDLNELHKDLKNQIEAINEDQRLLITDHDSLGYFAREYHMTVAGTIIDNLSSNKDSSSKSISKLISLINDKKIKAIFIGESASSDLIKLAENIKEEIHFPIKIIKLKTDTLGQSDSLKDPYLEYMRFNMKQIIEGLQSYE